MDQVEDRVTAVRLLEVARWQVNAVIQRFREQLAVQLVYNNGAALFPAA